MVSKGKADQMKIGIRILLGCVIAVACHGCYTCVSECVPNPGPLRDVDRQMTLVPSLGKDLEYWIDGERETPGCHWHLMHIKCQRGGCFYRCRETEALWRLSQQRSLGLKMDKCGDSTLPQTYIFSLPPADGN